MPTGKKKGRKGRKKKEQSVEIPSDKYEFECKEIILCHHQGQLYKAKVLKRSIDTNKPNSEEPLYYVHYHGWNQQWDEWVASDRCYKHTPQNIEKQTQLAQTTLNITSTTTATAISTTNTNNNTNNFDDNILNNNTNNFDDNILNNNTNNFDDNILNNKKKNKKRQIEDSEEDESDTNNNNKEDEYFQALINRKNDLKRKDIDDLELNKKITIHANKKRKLNGNDNVIIGIDNSMYNKNKLKEKLSTIVIPIGLKDNLCEQYNLIHFDKKLIKLPKEKGYRINDILNGCLMEQKGQLLEKENEINKNVDDINSLKTIINTLPCISDGIRGFFRNTLRLNLLYNFEKIQLDKIKILYDSHNNYDLCDIYGSEHLIRLFYILPNILFHTKGINENNFGEIKQCISIIIQFINKNKGKYLIDYSQMENVNKYAQDVNQQYIMKYNQIKNKYDNNQNHNGNNNDDDMH